MVQTPSEPAIALSGHQNFWNPGAQERLYDQLSAMTEEDRVRILDPICQVVQGKITMPWGGEALANRIFALAVLDMYREWQTEIFSRE